jgi:NAD(P)-dependent dehydrogenase (short-subunit alcohol dehydrogenase family)
METIIQGNFAGHVLLTYLLFDILDKNEARIINLSSIVHPLSDFKNEVNIKELYDAEKSKSKYYTGFEPKWRLYSNTKMLMLYFSKYLTNICEEKYQFMPNIPQKLWRYLEVERNILIFAPHLEKD